MSYDEVEEAWSKALIRSTAQTVFDNLTRIDNAPAQFQNRWLWELFQNAVDAADSKRLDINIELDRDSFRFSHNGLPFTTDEAIQLILHGSTKRMQAGKIGKFGTGFITTHLLSRVVDVYGILSNGRNFRFKLDRIAKTPKELEEKMTEAKTQLKATSELREDVSESFKTNYFFHILTEASYNLTLSNLQNLENVLPYVLSFNEELVSVKIIRGNKWEYWTKADKREIEQGINMIEVKRETNESANLSSTFHIAIAHSSECSASVRLELRDGQWTLQSGDNVPKIFIAFPLFGTEDFPLPAIINSRLFEPTDERDGIWLFAGTPEAEHNKNLLSKGIDLILNLDKIALAKTWNSLHNLARLKPIPEKKWLDPVWTKNILVQKLVVPLMDMPLIKVVNGSNQTPKTSYIPYSPDPDVRKDLWLLSSLLYPEKVPAEPFAAEWAFNLELWCKLLGMQMDQFPEILSLTKLAEQVSKLGSLKQLGNALNEVNDQNIIDKLNAFLKVIRKKDEALLTRLPLLPDQNGAFHIRKELCHDTGIDEILKNITKDLGIDEKSKLLGLDVSQELQDLLAPRNQQQVLTELLSTVKAKAKSDSMKESYQHANIKLFSWLVTSSAAGPLNLSVFKGYPVITRKKLETAPDCITEISDEPLLLPPLESWAEHFRSYGELFPPEHIMASEYLQSINDSGWKKLSDANIVLSSPIVKLISEINKEDLAFLLSEGEALNDEVDHKVKAEVISLALLERERGVMDRIRDSQDRAIMFLDFLLNQLVKLDHSWDHTVEVECECGVKHRIYPSLWLCQIKKRTWVPLSRTKKDRRKATAFSLSRLFEGREDLQSKLMEDDVSKLLSRLSISVTDIIRNIAGKEDIDRLNLDKAMVKVLLASGKDIDILNKIAVIWSDPNLRTNIEAIENRQNLIHRNQEIGSTVEEMLKAVLATEGITITRTGRGSDFEYEYENDYVGSDGQIILKVDKFLLEIKATKEKYIKMTPTQAEEAVKTGKNYILCVVKMADDIIDQEMVRHNVRFVFEVGQRLEPFVKAVSTMQSEEYAITSQAGEVELSIERTNVRFKVNELVWVNGMTINELITTLKNGI